MSTVTPRQLRCEYYNTETAVYSVFVPFRRRYNWAGFHADIYDKVSPVIENKGLDCECVGGGRILHDAEAKTIEVYGYSQGYGLADHAKSVELIKAKFPDYGKVTFSNDGY